MVRRTFVVVCGIAVAITAAVFACPIALGVVLASHNGGTVPTAEAIVAQLAWFAMTPVPDQIAEAALRALWWSLVVICCVPVILAALVGEAARLRGFLWCVGATAAISAAIPLAMHPGSGPVAGETAVLIAVGALAGFAYWLVAGEAAEPQKSALRS